MNVELRFFNGIVGLGVQVLLVAERHGLLFDLGTPFEARRGPFNDFVRPRPGKEVEDLLRVGWAPPIAGLYAGDPELVAEDAVRDLDGLAVFTSHADPDHMALLPYLRPEVPVHALAGTMRSYRALGIRHPTLRTLSPDTSFSVGPIDVRVLPVDHGPAGAAGFIARAGEVRIAYSGDWRWHGFEPRLVDDFVAACRAERVHALLVDGTRATSERLDSGPELRADDVRARADAALAGTYGFVLHSFFHRNVPMLEAFQGAFVRAGRRLVAHPETVAFLEGWYEGTGRALNVTSYADADVVDAVVRHPERFVIEQRLEDFPLLAEIFARAERLHGRPFGRLLLQGDGFPLGSFDPAWETLQTWWTLLRIERVSLNVNGHATPEDLERFIGAIGPDTVVPLHTWAPETVAPSHPRVYLPLRGEALRLRPGTLAS